MDQQVSVPETSLKQTLPTSLKFIANKLKDQQSFSTSEMRTIIAAAKVKQEDLMPWADFNHPTSDSYGRKLVYKGQHFEIMVMSWAPGDFSAIHDHGYTQWGAVQLFGPAEHATFVQMGPQLVTTSRSIFKTGDIVEVCHDLIHQMGNSSEETPFLSLHVYGFSQPIDNVTGDARIFDLAKGLIHRVDGGVFYGLPQNEWKRSEPGPIGDYPTQLRHHIELVRRVRRMTPKERARRNLNLGHIVAQFQSANQWSSLKSFLLENTDENGHFSNSFHWQLLNYELKEAAKLQHELANEENSTDHFHQYASLYDTVICEPALHDFMASYLSFFVKKYQPEFSKQNLISLGCGTGLVEKHLIDQLRLPFDNLFGIDISPAMISEASKRIRAEKGDVLKLNPVDGLWDIAYSGLNVFHYLDHNRLEEAIQKAAAIIKPGGYFLGDFITPDHIRWYPNVLFSEDEQVISLRTPKLVEEKGKVFQQSEIINIRFQEGLMQVTYAGKHKRFLPPVHRIRQYFENAFGGKVALYDAYSLQPIQVSDDSCASTRYIVIAQKNDNI